MHNAIMIVNSLPEKNVNQDILGRFEKLLQNTFDTNETLESGIPTVKELGEKNGYVKSLSK